MDPRAFPHFWLNSRTVRSITRGMKRIACSNFEPAWRGPPARSCGKPVSQAVLKTLSYFFVPDLILILILMTMFMVLSSWRGHCESSPGSFDECRLSARWPPTLKPSQTTWLVSLPVGCYHPHPPISMAGAYIRNY